ncbi:MAG: hypothetical protein JNN04_09950 [Cyclobacteriaceae bacterium]|nr:hypothetical protein [Cyclobacteriaceae bacterium]
MRQISRSETAEELPNGFIKLANGTCLTPAQFERLQEVDAETLYILFVDPVLQTKRTEAGDKSPIIEFKD